MRFLVDESTGQSVVEFLRGLGHDVVAVADSMPQAIEPDILAAAAADARVIVTNDKDFGELVFRLGIAHRGVVLLRLRHDSADNKKRVLQSVLNRLGEQIVGRFVIATETHVRVR